MDYISTSIPGSNASINDDYFIDETVLQSNDHLQERLHNTRTRSKHTLTLKSEAGKLFNFRSVINDLLKEHSDKLQKPNSNDPSPVTKNKPDTYEQPTITAVGCNSGVINVEGDEDDEIEMFELIEVEEELSDGEEDSHTHEAQLPEQPDKGSVNTIVTVKAFANSKPSDQPQANQSQRVAISSVSPAAKCTPTAVADGDADTNSDADKKTTDMSKHNCEYCSEQFKNLSELLAHLKLHLPKKPVRTRNKRPLK